MLGFEDSIKTITTISREAEDAGVHSLYTVDAGRSATITAAAVINATQVSRVGTYIVNAYAREPWMTGLEARDLNEISEGRFVLGVGTGNLESHALLQVSTQRANDPRDLVEDLPHRNHADFQHGGLHALEFAIERLVNLDQFVSDPGGLGLGDEPGGNVSNCYALDHQLTDQVHQLVELANVDANRIAG